MKKIIVTISALLLMTSVQAADASVNSQRVTELVSQLTTVCEHTNFADILKGGDGMCANLINGTDHITAKIKTPKDLKQLEATLADRCKISSADLCNQLGVNLRIPEVGYGWGEIPSLFLLTG